MVSSGECSQIIFFDNFQLFIFSFLSFFLFSVFWKYCHMGTGPLGPVFYFCVSPIFQLCLFGPLSERVSQSSNNVLSIYLAILFKISRSFF